MNSLNNGDLIKNQRNIIDNIDSEILKLLQQRMKAVIEIGRLKEQTGGPIYRPEREKYIIEKLQQLNHNSVLPNEALYAIYINIMSASRSLEGNMSVACLGPSASFTELAAIKKFGNSTKLHLCKNIEEVFLNIDKNITALGIVPIENSSEGLVNSTLDSLQNSNLLICSEFYLAIHQNLLSKETDFKNIKSIYSHPQGLAQCKNWIENNLPFAELKEVSSTSKAAEIVSHELGSAAVSSITASETYNLNVLAENIEDNKDNHTRFIVISKNIEPDPTDNDKTSILFNLPDKPGALLEILKLLSDFDLNMSKISSRPSRKKAFEYSFFIDFNGHVKNDVILKCIKEIRTKTLSLKLLGSYPNDNKIHS